MTIKVWGSGRLSLWSFGATVTIPEEYDFLPAGDGPRTRAVVKAARQQGSPVYSVMEKNRKNGYSRQVGVWVPAALLELPVKRTPAAKLAELREKKEQREIARFAARILAEFPGCPAEEAEEIAQHACVTGSGRVGRSRTADDPVRAAVVAHVRHAHTDYDKLLFAGTEREDARDMVRDDITAVLRGWEVPPVSNDPAPVAGEHTG
jgi:hypothetical protein